MDNCARHENIEILLLCMEPECWEIVCSECLYSHMKQKHSDNIGANSRHLPFGGRKKDVNIKALKSIQGEIANFLMTLKCMYQKESKRLNNLFLRINRENEDNLEKIRSAKEKIINLIISQFQKIEEDYNQKTHLDALNKHGDDLSNLMKSNIARIDSFQRCFSDTYNYKEDYSTLEILLKEYGKDKLSNEQYLIMTDIYELTMKSKELYLKIQVDESKLLTVEKEFDKYIKVIEQVTPCEVDLLQIEMGDYFKPESPKFLHFFEDGTRNLHLFTLDRSSKSSLPNRHEVYKLNNRNWLIPSYHRSLATPLGDIYLTGGNEDDTGRDTTAVYKFNNDEKILENIESMNKPRSNHAAINFEDAIYVVGGNSNELGCIGSCERYKYTENNKWEQIANLNIASFGLSLCVFRDKTLYKFGGKKNKWELSNTIEVYNSEQNVWKIVPFDFDTQYDRRSFILPYYSAAIQINKNDIFILGGCDVNDNKLVQTFIFSIEENEEAKLKNFVVKGLNKRPLIEPEYFETQQVVIFKKKLFTLQNSSAEALTLGSYGGCATGNKKLLVFKESEWLYWK